MAVSGGIVGALTLVGAVNLFGGRSGEGVCGVGARLYECIGSRVFSCFGVCACVRGFVHLVLCARSVDTTDDIGPELGV